MLIRMAILGFVLVQNQPPARAPYAGSLGKQQNISKSSEGASTNQNEHAEIAIAVEPPPGVQANGQSKGDEKAASNDPRQLWSLSDKIAVGACIAGFAQFLALITTIWIMIRNGRRQLRAYVIVERGIIANVANPISEYGKRQATVAQLSVPSTGPVAQITIKNTGQTPAYKLVHWGNMEIREFPLTSQLPEMPPPPEPFCSVLGPTIAEVKTLRIRKPLSEEEILGLRDGSKAAYCHGTIVYRDAFNKACTTHYRVMYSAITGIEIGTSTDLTVCSRGNEAT